VHILRAEGEHAAAAKLERAFDLLPPPPAEPVPTAPGTPEAPLGLPSDPSDANRQVNQMRAEAETRRHLQGLSLEQAGEQFLQELLSGKAQ
jgi:hypothetical protein